MRHAVPLLVGMLSHLAIALATPSITGSPSTADPISGPTSYPYYTFPAPITTGTVVRPSQGGTVTAGQAYTVTWSPPPVSGPIDIELWDNHNTIFNAADLTGNLTPNTTCDGWVINGDCGKIAKNLQSESTSFVWYIPDLIDNEADSIVGDQFSSFWLGVYIGGLPSNYLPTVQSPWYLRSNNFTVEVIGKSTSTDYLHFSTSSTSPSSPSSTSTQKTTSSSTHTTGTATVSATGSVAATSSGAAMSIVGSSGPVLVFGVAGFVGVILI